MLGQRLRDLSGRPDVVVVDQFELGVHDIGPIIVRERRELTRREQLYRGERPFADLTDMTVILVDDGLATGSAMRAAVSAVRTRPPSSVIAGPPVASRQANDMLREVADRCVTVAVPEPFFGVGLWYEDFSETSDEEVLALLQRSTPRELEAAATG